MQFLTVLSLLLSLSVAKANTCSAQMNDAAGSAISPPKASDANSEAVPLDEVSLLQAQVLLRSTEATVEGVQKLGSSMTQKQVKVVKKQMSEGFVQADETEDFEAAGKNAQESGGCIYGYTTMPYNTNSCTHGCPATHGCQAIQDPATCESAANSLKYEWKRNPNIPPSPRFPKGCMFSRWGPHRKLVRFNTHSSGDSNQNAAPICCAACGTGYTVMNYNTNACTHGSRAIQDRATCESAAKSLNYLWRWEFRPAQPFPKGCLVWKRGNQMKVYFNQHATGFPDPEQAPICCTR